MAIVHRTVLGQRLIGCAIEVHTQLGPGLLESTYCQCLAYELKSAGIPFQQQVVIPVVYKGAQLDCGYRADFVADDRLLVEIKSVDHRQPIHLAQVMTYLKLSHCEQALLFNFNTERLKDGMKSFLSRRAPT